MLHLSTGPVFPQCTTSIIMRMLRSLRSAAPPGTVAGGSLRAQDGLPLPSGPPPPLSPSGCRRRHPRLHPRGCGLSPPGRHRLGLPGLFYPFPPRTSLLISLFLSLSPSLHLLLPFDVSASPLGARPPCPIRLPNLPPPSRSGLRLHVRYKLLNGSDGGQEEKGTTEDEMAGWKWKL